MTLSLLAWERTRRANVRALLAEKSGLFAERTKRGEKRMPKEPPPTSDPDLWKRSASGRLFRGRDGMLSEARSLVWWRMRYKDELSLPEIALRTMGRTTAHTSVLGGLRSLARTAAAEKTKRTLQGDGR